MIKKYLVIAFILSLSFLSYGEEAPLAAAAQAADATTAAEAVVTTTSHVVPAANAESTKLAEDQIPLLIATDKKNAEVGTTTSKAVASGVIIMVLLGASYYYVRKYKTSNLINKSNMQIKVLTQHYLGPKKSLAIIHVAGESILLGITDTNISMIKSLSLIDDEVPVDMPKTFNESLTRRAALQGGSTTASSASTTNETSVDELDEEFSFAGVTDTVSKKIKSMRSFS